MVKDRRILKLSIIYVVFAFSLLIGISMGSLKIGIVDVIKAIFFETDTLNHNIIYNVRLPRNLAAAFVGINLALSGVTLQGVMNNPLADPGIIGISSGAGLMAFVIMILFPDYTYLVPIGAFIGAVLTTFLIYTLAWKNGVSPVRLILSGVAVSAFLGAGINILMTFYPERVQGGLSFMIGGLSGKTWPDLILIWPYTLAAGLLSLLLSNQINLLQLGDEVATGLGLNVERIRTVFIILSALLAASAVSVAGLLGFVGLIVPHIARLIIGSDYRYLYPATIGLGGAVLVGCDTIARMMFDPIELPVGIIMAVLGAPFFLYLLREKK
ncbi:iron ABC transporter permease [Acidaminobacter sp. JC074]|uniref:FecCD family ABC transporter permease n=1 Tax=Acidaminobacter sp. JC074 TaxID=2530199 RepID=UPI001F10E392|nr:iron ABC transporter permease [Acidaminobacter sp. JC074]MCH4888260.1 iron ABC transporter permease [Acidaminobacter sp. JC074]